MKRFFSVCISIFALAIIFQPIETFAAPILNTEVTGTTITTTITNLGNINPLSLTLVIQKDPFAVPIKRTIIPTILPGATTTRVNDSSGVIWTTTGLSSSTTYYIRVEQDGVGSSPYISTPKKVSTEVAPIKARDLIYGEPNSSCTSIYIGGVLESRPVSDYTISLEYSRVQIPSEGEVLSASSSVGRLQSGPGPTAGLGIGESGTYGFELSNLTPSSLYFTKQIIKSKSGAVDIKMGSFNSCKGYMAQGSVEETSDLAKRSYTLLAPLPWMKVLLDQDLCKEYEAAGKSTGGIACDNQIGSFINMLLTVLIGLSAVVLVVKIIILGFQYMTTDIPFVKINAKSGLITSFMGLLLALSSYLILNTINPKLVTGTLGVEGIDIGVEKFEGDSASYQQSLTYSGGSSGMAGYNFSSAKFPTGIICPKQGGQSVIESVAKSFIGKITYSQPSRGSSAPGGNMYLDCSSYVTTVLLCSGITPLYSYAQTSTIFKGKEAVTSLSVTGGKGIINGKELKVGDLIGWKDSDKVSCGKNGCSGHVTIYVGNGMVMDSHSGEGKKPGKSVTQPFSLESYKEKYRWIYRI